MDDVLDGAIGFVEGGFELAVWPWLCRGLMLKEAVCEGSAELLVEEDEEQGDLGSFLSQPIGVSLSVASEQAMRF